MGVLYLFYCFEYKLPAEDESVLDYMRHISALSHPGGAPIKSALPIRVFVRINRLVNRRADIHEFHICALRKIID
jgi:hypothetical protein